MQNELGGKRLCFSLRLLAGFLLLAFVACADVVRPLHRDWSIFYMLPAFYAAWRLAGCSTWVLGLATILSVYLVPICFRGEIVSHSNFLFNRFLGILTGVVVIGQAARLRRDAGLLKQLNDDLELRVADRTKELAATNKSLRGEIEERQRSEERQRGLEQQLRQSQKMEAIGRLAGGVAHYFNNLLTVILGNGEFTMNSLPSNHPVRESVGEIVDAADRAASLTQQLLAFSRKSVLVPKVLSLNDVVCNSEKLLLRLIGGNIQLEKRLDAEECFVKADPNLLEQALMNLVINARDAISERGRIEISTSVVESSSIADGTESQQPIRYAVLAVADTGSGMTEELKSRIFEPFFTTKPVGQGSGLGLSVVKGIVEQSGGWIEVISQPGSGSTFKLYFPAVDETSEAPQPTEISPVDSKSETILIVEDEESVRKLVVLRLESWGYHVLVAGDGLEAMRLAEIRSAPIDLLLTDIVMPRMGGVELAMSLREHIPDLKVILVSGYSNDVMLHEAQKLPNVHYLQKPFSPTVLAQKIRSILDDQHSDDHNP